ncbi:MAG: amidohydrolase [Deltaproteobacteria bacterium]|nr:amidohydrolase [Deltaproteobacteria bacterium]
MPADPPAALYTGGEIVTLAPGHARPEALATVGDRIVAVGEESECRAALRSAGVADFSHLDLTGRCLLPGFIDTHLHPIALVYFDLNADLRGVRSIAELQGVLRAAAARLPPGEWLVGLRLEDAELAERRLPARLELDAVSAERPIVVLKHDGHSAAGNSPALAAAGIAAGTTDPPGGRIERDTAGVPTGPCRESAAQLLFGAVPVSSLERLQATARTSFARLSACGITSAGVVLQTDEEGPGGAAGRLESLALQLLLGEVPFCTYAILIGRSVGAALAARSTPLHNPSAGRRVGGFKIFADGTFGSCTASLREPFADRPETRGFLTLAEDEIFARMRAAHTAGLQVCVHAIGDAAVERCVTLFERLLREQPRPDHRHRLEHASLVPPGVIGRIARCGLHVSTQPLFIHSEKTWLPRRLGAERARQAYPLRALIDAGIVIGGASDAPVESTDVLHAIQCCVTREGFATEQALTPLEAVRLFTRDAARLQFEEHEKGTLVAGKRADLVVLSANPLEVAPERIAGIRVLRTITGGRVVHDDRGDLA